MSISWLMQNEGRVAGSVGPLFFMSASKPATVESLELVERELFRLGQHYGSVSFLMVIRPNRAERVTPEARERLAQMLKAVGSVCLGEAMVVDAKGLLGTIVRAFLTTLSLMTAGNGYPTKVFATIPEGLNWLAALPRQDGGFSTYRSEVEGYFAAPQQRSA